MLSWAERDTLPFHELRRRPSVRAIRLRHLLDRHALRTNGLRLGCVVRTGYQRYGRREFGLATLAVVDRRTGRSRTLVVLLWDDLAVLGPRSGHSIRGDGVGVGACRARVEMQRRLQTSVCSVRCQ